MYLENRAAVGERRKKHRAEYHLDLHIINQVISDWFELIKYTGIYETSSNFEEAYIYIYIYYTKALSNGKAVRDQHSLQRQLRTRRRMIV